MISYPMLLWTVQEVDIVQYKPKERTASPLLITDSQNNSRIMAMIYFWIA